MLHTWLQWRILVLLFITIVISVNGLDNPPTPEQPIVTNNINTSNATIAPPAENNATLAPTQNNTTINNSNNNNENINTNVPSTSSEEESGEEEGETDEYYGDDEGEIDGHKEDENLNEQDEFGELGVDLDQEEGEFGELEGEGQLEGGKEKEGEGTNQNNKQECAPDGMCTKCERFERKHDYCDKTGFKVQITCHDVADPSKKETKFESCHAVVETRGVYIYEAMAFGLFILSCYAVRIRRAKLVQQQQEKIAKQIGSV